MKSKYYVIDKKGNIHEPEKYLKSNECSREMKICIEREVNELKASGKLDSSYQKIAAKLGFSWENNSEIGFLNYDYKANLLVRLVQEYARKLVNQIGFPIFEVKGSNFFDMQYPVVEAYAGLFGDRLFKFNAEGSNLVMSYDASYPQFNLAQKYQLSAKDLPFAHFSISDCYRNEQSGECMLLYRSRRFYMPDVHPYFRDINEAWSWYSKIEDQLIAGFKLAKRRYINIAKVSSEANWEQYKEKICNIAKSRDQEMLVDIKMDKQDRYWIVDIDYSIIDSFEQVREIGCIQIDIGNAKRLGIKYVKADGKSQDPVIIHCAIPGGIERYIYMLIDSYKEFPLELQPVQLRLVPVSEKFNDYAVELAEKFRDLRIEVDDRSESVGKRVRLAHDELIPNVIVIGEKEVQSGLAEEQIQAIACQVNNGIVPFLEISWPKLVSKQVR